MGKPIAEEKESGRICLNKHVGNPVLPSPSTNFVSQAGGTMGISTLIRRGTEILVALIVAVSSIALISSNTPYVGTTADLMSSTLLCEYNNIKNITSDQYSDKSNYTAKDILKNANNGDIYINPEFFEGSITDMTLNQADPILADTACTLQSEGEVNTLAEPELVKESVGVLNEPVYKFATDTLNVRQGPGAEAEKLGTLEKGDRVQSFEVQNEYLKIKTSDNIEGYVLAEYVADSLPPVYKYVNADKLNLRKGPSAETEKLGTLNMGARVQFLELHGDWALIIASNGIKGYSLSKYITSENVSISRATTNLPYYAESASSVIEYAKQFLGVPYVYGGSTPKGFDCSGFTQYVYNRFNIKVPRSAKEYDGTGVKVDRSNMKPGDVILFDRYNDYRLGHVGIYLGGNQFIHASSSKGKVVIGELSKYGGNILGIRRVIK